MISIKISTTHAARRTGLQVLDGPSNVSLHLSPILLEDLNVSLQPGSNLMLFLPDISAASFRSPQLFFFLTHSSMCSQSREAARYASCWAVPVFPERLVLKIRVRMLSMAIHDDPCTRYPSVILDTPDVAPKHVVCLHPNFGNVY